MKNIFSLPKAALVSLVCTSCNKKPSLSLVSKGLACPKCKTVYPIKKISYEGIEIQTPLLYQEPKEQPEAITLEGYTDYSNHLLHNEAFEPTLSASIAYDHIISEIQNKQGLIIDNGSGTNSFKYISKKPLFTTEIKKYGRPYYPIQVFADSASLPLKSNSAEIFISNFVIQEVKDKRGYFNEMHRILKKQGLIYVSFPSPYWYLAYFISPASWKKYLKSIIKNPKAFFKHPFHHFLYENTHGRKENSFLKELLLFRAGNHEKIFITSGFTILRKIQSGNILALYPRYKHLSEIFKNWDIKSGIHYTYVLKK